MFDIGDLSWITIRKKCKTCGSTNNLYYFGEVTKESHKKGYEEEEIEICNTCLDNPPEN